MFKIFWSAIFVSMFVYGIEAFSIRDRNAKPSVDETEGFLGAMLASHGPNYLEKIFGPKARDALAPFGGIMIVARALNQARDIDDIGVSLHLMRSDMEHLRSIFKAVDDRDIQFLKSLSIKDVELEDFMYFMRIYPE